MSKEYYDIWAEEELSYGRTPTPIHFMKEFGTPVISLLYPEKEKNYIELPSELVIEVRYSYFSDLKKKFPTVQL